MKKSLNSVKAQLYFLEGRNKMQNQNLEKNVIKRELVIIGGGPAGMAAAVSAKESGVNDIVIIERDACLGGILQQCIHNGFGLTRFKENLTGPEYAYKFESKVVQLGIEIMYSSTVINLSENKTVTVTNSERGIFNIEADAVILAMGCRERSKGALNIAGFRPSGLLSAGTAQKYINIRGEKIGNDIVILGSGDIGLIMARRMTLEGAKVHAVIEIMPHSSGLRRNIAQCLDDFNIPLYLSQTITYIHGKNRVEGVTVASVDENRMPIKSTERFIACDTVLFSVGLVPENELTKMANVKISSKTKGAEVSEGRETSVDGIFACGNVLQVHDLVDFVSEESEICGRSAANYVINKKTEQKCTCKNEDFLQVIAGKSVSYVVPMRICKYTKEDVKLFFRPTLAKKNIKITVNCGGVNLISRKKIAVAPGEMETIMLPKKIIETIRGEITVDILEETK